MKKKKLAKRSGAKRGTKKAKDLSAKRGPIMGANKYTLFLPDGTAVRAKEPTSLEFPN